MRRLDDQTMAKRFGMRRIALMYIVFFHDKVLQPIDLCADSPNQGKIE
jgi:hypothetical protein